MPAQIFDGKKIAVALQLLLEKEISQYLEQGHRAPELAVVLVGADPASEIYIRNKQLACQRIGIISHLFTLPVSTSESEVLQLIEKLNTSATIDGILVQSPLPAHIHFHAIMEAIHPGKDVDGFHPYNLGRLAQRQPSLRPCTPAGIMRLLSYTERPLKGLDATVVGVSNTVGRPMILELLMAGCTVTACHSQTRDLKHHVENADLLIAAVGNPHLIQGSWIKPGAIVIDVGINRLADGRLMGDVDFALAKTRASWITPVPGGVGPMTVTLLLENTLIAYKQHLNIGSPK